MSDNNLIETIINHKNARDLLSDLLNGTNAWLLDTLAQLEPETDKSKEGAIKTRLSTLLRDYLETLYGLQRQEGITQQSYIDFLQKDAETPKTLLTYLLKTLQTKYKDAFLAASIAVLISLERIEDSYRGFLEGLAASNNPHIADDPSIALVVFNTFVLQNKLCAAVP